MNNLHAKTPQTLCAAAGVTSLHTTKTKFALKQKLLILLFALWGFAGFGQISVSINNYLVPTCIPPSNVPTVVCSGGNVILQAQVTGLGSGSYNFTWSTSPVVTQTNIFTPLSGYSLVELSSLSPGLITVTVFVQDVTVASNNATSTYVVQVMSGGTLPLASASSNNCPFNTATLTQANTNTQFIGVYPNETFSGTVPYGLNEIIGCTGAPSLSSPPVTTTVVPIGASSITEFVALANTAGTCQNIQQLNVNAETYTSCGTLRFVPRVLAGTLLTQAMVPPTGSTFFIEGDITISGIVNFTGIIVDMAPGATINVPSGSSLNINGSWLRVCPASGCMWKGIVVTGNGKVYSSNASIIEDAIVAINVPTPSATPLLHITQTLFNKNTIAIEIFGIYATTNLSSQITIDNNIFTCRAFSTPNLTNLLGNVTGAGGFNHLFSHLQTNWATASPATTTTNYGQTSNIGVAIYNYTNANLITVGSGTPTGPGYRIISNNAIIKTGKIVVMQ